MIKSVVKLCKQELDLDSEIFVEQYKSLSICIIDCIYSLRARYKEVTKPVVVRYAMEYMNGDCFAPGDTTENLIQHIEQCGGCSGFSDLLKNHQKSGGREKSEICYELAQKFVENNIFTLQDFQNGRQSYLEFIIKSIKGIGNAALNYLFMLAGDPNRCKPDIHIHNFISNALNRNNVTDSECQNILKDVVVELQHDYPKLTVRQLDWLIWEKGQSDIRKK